MERSFFPTEFEARRELAHGGLISKHHNRPQMILFGVLDDPRWQANKEEKQGRFRLDRYRHFAFQHGSMVYNPRDHKWIPNATDNPWANCPGKDSEHEYHVIHTLEWSLQLTNIALPFDIASEHMYYGKVRIRCNLERDHCPPNYAVIATVIWEPENHCRFLMLEDHTHVWLNFKKAISLKHLKIMKLNLVTNTCHISILVVFKNTFMMNLHFHVLSFSQNFSINLMKIAHVMPLNIKTFLYKTQKFLILSREKRHPTLMTHK